MEKPASIELNGRRITVRGWDVTPDGIRVSTIVSGDRNGRDLEDVIRSGEAMVAWDGFESAQVATNMAEHQVVGEGPRAVHRIAFDMQSASLPHAGDEAMAAPAPEDVWRMVRELQQEIAELRRRMAVLEQFRRN